jgi:two-component system response regulator
MSAGPKILIIEDEAMLRDAYEFILTSKGYRVMSAENGRVGLKILDSNVPDLILLDLLMPVLGGKDFLLQAALRETYPHVKVIVYSNVSDQDTVHEVLKLGAHKHILKSSMSPNDLVEQVNVLLSTLPPL